MGHGLKVQPAAKGTRKKGSISDREIPGHLCQLGQEDRDCLVIKASQLCDQLVEEASSQGILLIGMQALQVLESLHNGLSLLWW